MSDLQQGVFDGLLEQVDKIDKVADSVILEGMLQVQEESARVLDQPLRNDHIGTPQQVPFLFVTPDL